MSDSIFPTVSAGDGMMRSLEMISNNLVNMNTPGYKKDFLVYEETAPNDTASSQSAFEGQFGMHEPVQDKIYASSSMQFTDYSQGSLKQTGQSTDIGIDGDGFFVIDTPEGDRYSRNGNFTLNRDSVLSTNAGHLVQGNNGPITITDVSYKIMPDGAVIQNGIETDKIKIVDFPKPYPFEKLGGTLFKLREEGEMVEPKPPENCKLVQGSLEMSNANAVNGLTELIAVSRAFESYQRVIQNYSSLNSRAVKEIARV